MSAVRKVPLSLTSEIVLGLAVTEGWPVEAILPQSKHPGSPDECVKALIGNYADRLHRRGML